MLRKLISLFVMSILGIGCAAERPRTIEPPDVSKIEWGGNNEEEAETLKRVAENWCRFQQDMDYRVCLIDQSFASRMLVGDHEDRFLEIMDPCAREHANQEHKAIDLVATWDCMRRVFDEDVAAENERREEAIIREQKDRAHQVAEGKRMERLLNEYLESSQMLCFENYGEQSTLCYEPIILAADYLAQYQIGYFPQNIVPEYPMDVQGIVDRCIDRTKDGKHIYAPTAILCIAGTIQSRNRDFRRTKRLEREATE